MSDFMFEFAERKVRIFISSTFRDMMQERELLIKRIFPQLHHWCKERQIEMTEVDLRWGITEQEAKEGKVVEICLNEIDKSRPYFIGILGERYGWVPNDVDVNKQKRLMETYPWLAEDIKHGLSITDMEMQYGVLRCPQLKGHAFFYIKNKEFMDVNEQNQQSEEEITKLKQLKEAVKSQNLYPYREYGNLQELGNFVLNDLKAVIEQEFPDLDIPDELQKARLDHISFINSRTGVYIKNQQMFTLLEQHVIEDTKPLVLAGVSGTGKSALLSNWIVEHNKLNTEQYFLFHFCGCNSESADTQQMLKRLLEEINEHFSLNQKIPFDLHEMAEALPYFLAKTSGFGKWILVIDALNQLSTESLDWLPVDFPTYIRVIVSTTQGKVLEELKTRNWKIVEVPLLNKNQKTELINNYLQQFSKKLDGRIAKKIADSKMTENALVLRTLLDELRLFGLHEGLSEQVKAFTHVRSEENFFGMILKRFEIEYLDRNQQIIKEMLTILWASKKGLSEREILEILNIPRILLSQLLSELDGHLITLGGLLCFSHSYMRNAIERRYLLSNKAKILVHQKLAAYFENKPYDLRSLEELPYQLSKIKDWRKLRNYLTDKRTFLLFMSKSPYELCYCWKDLSKKYNRFNAYRLSFQNNNILSEDDCLLAMKIGDFLELSSDYKSAAYFYKISLKLCTKLYGKNSEQTSVAYSKLSGIYNILNLYGKSLFASKNSLSIQKKIFGEHADMIDNYNNIADIYWHKGEFSKAIQNNEKALSLCLKYLGEEHEKTATTLHEIGWVYEAQGLYELSLKNLLKASDIFRKRFGENSPQSAECYTSLAWVYDWLGDYEKLFEFANKSHAIYQYVYGEYHSEIGLTYKLLGTGYYRLGDYRKALACYEKAKTLWIRIYGKKHIRPAAASFQMALAYIKNKEYLKAITELEESIEIEKSVLGTGAADLAINYNHLGFAYTLLGEYGKGLNNLNYALDEAMKVYGRLSNDVAESHYYLSIHFHLNNDNTKSLESSLEALDIRKSLYGENHPETALSLYFSSKLLQLIGENDIYQTYLSDAIRIFKNTKTQHLREEIDELFDKN